MEIECSICLDLLWEVTGTSGTTVASSTPKLTFTSCGHIFHETCAQEWVGLRNSCPICRKKVTERQLLPAFLEFFKGRQAAVLKELRKKVDALEVKLEASQDSKKVLQVVVRQLEQENEELEKKIRKSGYFFRNSNKNSEEKEKRDNPPHSPIRLGYKFRQTRYRSTRLQRQGKN